MGGVNPFKLAERIIKGESVGIEELKGKEYILLKILGFGDINKADRINRYMWNVDQNIVSGLLELEISELRRLPYWIKGRKKGDLVDSLIVRYFKNNDLDVKEIDECYELIRRIVEENLKEFLKECGASEEEYEKLNVELVKKRPKVGLERWF